MIFYNKKAFTLIELLVGISIITTIIILGTNLNYNSISQKENLDIFTNKIKTNFETIRNNELAGKGFGINLDIPDKWQIEYSKYNGGTIIANAFSGNVLLSNENFKFENGFSIDEIKCGKIAEDPSLYKTLDDTLTGSVIFQKSKISLDWNGDPINCNNDTHRIMEVTLKYKLDTRKIIINSVNGLVDLK